MTLSTGYIAMSSWLSLSLRSVVGSWQPAPNANITYVLTDTPLCLALHRTRPFTDIFYSGDPGTSEGWYSDWRFKFILVPEGSIEVAYYLLQLGWFFSCMALGGKDITNEVGPSYNSQSCFAIFQCKLCLHDGSTNNVEYLRSYAHLILSKSRDINTNYFTKCSYVWWWWWWWWWWWLHQCLLSNIYTMTACSTVSLSK